MKFIDDVSVIDLCDDWQIVKRDQCNTGVSSLVIEGKIRHVVRLIVVMFNVQVTNSHVDAFCHCSTNYGHTFRIAEIFTRCLGLPKLPILVHKFLLNLSIAGHLLQHRVFIVFILETIAYQIFNKGDIGRTIAEFSVNGL